MADSSQALVFVFDVFHGEKHLQTVEYTAESVTIGSGSLALLSLPGSGLADLHAAINVLDDGTVQLLDFGSEVGTILNGERVTTNAKLSSGDRIEFGKIALKLTLRRGDEATDEAELPTPRPAPERAQSAPAVTMPAPAMGPGMALDEAGEEIPEPESTEDVMSFVLRSGTATTSLGIKTDRPKVLEVNQMWGELLLDTRHFPNDLGRNVTVGSTVGWKWNLLGVDMGWVPAPLHVVLPFAPPMWSEVSSVWRDDFYASDEAMSGVSHDLFLFEEEGKYVANVQEGWDGFVDKGDNRYTFAELVQGGAARKEGARFLIPMEEDVRLMVDVNGVVFYAHKVFPGQRIVDRGSEQVDYPFIAISSFILFLGLLFGVLMLTLEPLPQSDQYEIPERFVELLMEQPEKEEIKKHPDTNPDAGEGAKAKREEGKVGKKDAKMKTAKGNKVDMAKQMQDRQIAENAGVLGALREGSDLDGVFGTSGLDSSITGGIGGLIGAKGTQIGSGGLGSRGSGLGGGGTAEGLGGLGTKGRGSGASGYGSGGGHFGDKSDGAISAVSGDPIILGALDRSLIDEVIKRHMNQIRYCYQRELTKNHNLQGKVVIKFVIAKDGSVSSASVKQSTIDSSAVDSCVASRFMHMQFPQPIGGGIVIVSYPFLFAPG
ncbi:MAG: AgmX/PglI C-terminal domain-containing protein [Deltaproteobacteria bacterium]|nr:AgmX/PglI C-terminal domain-containing protein [Deltaproteobacteria bacterium]